MIEAILYQLVFLLIVTVVTWLVQQQYKTRTVTQDLYLSGGGGAFLLMIFMIVFIGFRPHSSVFIDTMNYVLGYRLIEGNPFIFDIHAQNFIFDNLFRYCSANRLGITSFFLVIATIYFGCSLWAIRRLFPNDILAAYLTFLAAFSTFSYGTNGIKAGAAASVFLLALSYRGKWLPCFFWLLVSLGLHHSMKMPVAAFVLTLFFRKPSYYFGGWVLCAVMAVLHIDFFQQVFAGLSEDGANSYLVISPGSETDYITGFRFDFMVYSAMPVWVGYYAKYKKGLQSVIYDTLLYTYLAANGIWMLCMYASFTNRIAYLSWSLYPAVLIYPFLLKEWGEDRYQWFAKVMLWHLLFTLFMEMVYYGGFMRWFG